MSEFPEGSTASDTYNSWSGQGDALWFFSDLDQKTKDALGVVIIEGDHPGSDYMAAELRNDIGAANSMAEELGLPFRFMDEEI